MKLASPCTPARLWQRWLSAFLALVPFFLPALFYQHCAVEVFPSFTKPNGEAISSSVTPQSLPITKSSQAESKIDSGFLSHKQSLCSQQNC